MRDEQRRRAADPANPELFALHNTCADCNASDAPAFVRLAWKRWNVAIDEALALELKPWPLAESAAAGIWSEWHTDEGRPE